MRANIGVRRVRPGRGVAAAFAAVILGLALTACASVASPVMDKIDPRLAALLSADRATGATASVWVSFADKGEQGPADLARRLARAAALLEPRARARRVRAHVAPLVDYLDLPVEPAYLAALAAHGLRPYGVSRWFNRAAVRAGSNDLPVLAALPFVERIEPVETMRRMTPPVPDEGVATPPAGTTGARTALVSYGLMQSPMNQLHVPAVHDSGYIGTGMLVCVLDEGFNYWETHDALSGTIVLAQRDFVDGDEDVQDPSQPGAFSHGTWVMGCIAGNKPGTYVGAAYGASFILARTENNFTEKPIEMVNWGMGAEWADSIGADVINSSLGYNTFPDSAGTDYTYADMNGHTTIVSRAAEIAASKGMLLLSAVGNDGGNAWLHLEAPSDVNGDSLIAVGAVDGTGAAAGFSSHGPSSDGRIKPDLAADGVSVPACAADGSNTYTSLSGTSLSTPLVTGLATCLMQARPSWPPTLIIRALRATASRALSPDNLVGYGVPNGLAALQWTPDTAAVPPNPPGFLAFRLAGPNPFHSDGSSTTVQFALGSGEDVGTARVRVVDLQGRTVRVLAAAACPGSPGWNCASWDGRGEGGRELGPGIYVIAFEAPGRRASLRVVSLR